ncbi:ankyrin repeat domain-containing protein [Bodo saltans virus]|uniref:Ankyrin repeat domain-containing protein n=1 Tax=Bodo saltans virus TaxID=2024608 RepID=A0A2H4UT86_9VIRU|nr:ankyrin repeat domain-containing protein [Bodo saltans virus]ATZ80151.1 ankyrin repeat domain-containing protein [Bodo saltans virus]
METDWIIHTQLYDNLKKEKTLDVEKLNDIINKLIERPFSNDLNELIMNDNVEILFRDPKICEFFELVEFNDEKIKRLFNKFIDFAIKKTRNKFTFCDSYKNENGELYNFYKNMSLKTCFNNHDKCDGCYAAINGHLECLKYAHENGCPWDSNTCLQAAGNGHLECLKYAHENGCPWNMLTCEYAAKYGHLECLKYLHENGCPWNILTCAYAAQNGHLECLKYAHENGCPWNEYTCLNAAGNGHLECFKYAHENGCHWNEYTCLNAARNGHLECLKYAYENGCPWDKYTCSRAAGNGHLECFKYAHENGCPLDERTCSYAARNGHLECLKYAHENGCPLDEHIFIRNKDCLKYIKKKTSLLSRFAKKIDNFFFCN